MALSREVLCRIRRATVTALQMARVELEAYVAAIALRTEDLDAAKLRYLESRIEAAAMDLSQKAPF